MKSETKILIVEDEYVTVRLLLNFLKESGYEIAEYAMNVDKAISILETNTIDCVILDINLNTEKNGIWLANHIKKNYNIPFIYLTAYTNNEIVFKAIQTNPYGFLNKPFKRAELFSSIEIALFTHNNVSKLNKNISLSNGIDQEEFLFLKSKNSVEKVKLNSIFFVEADKNYLLIHAENNIQYKYRAGIKEFMKLLPKEKFIQSHRSFLVNIDMIESIDSSNNVIRIHEYRIPVSKTYKKLTIEKVITN